MRIAGAISPRQITEIAAEIRGLSAPAETDQQRLHYFEQARTGPLLCRTERFLNDSTLLKSLIVQGLLPDAAAELIGEQVLLFKEKINYKRVGGAGFAPHQDATAYDFIDHHVTCLLAIDEMTPENGCLEFAATRVTDLIPPADDGCIAPDIAADLDWVACPAEPGDLIYFDSYTPHRSGGNDGNQDRTAIYLTYNAATESDMRECYYRNRQRRMANGSGGSISTIGHFQGVPALPSKP